MNFPAFLFYIFSTVAVLSAICVISLRNTVHSVLFLVFSFVATAGVWLLLECEFLSLVLVLVYVGAVMTLFLFVVMMLDLRVTNTSSGRVKFWPLAVLLLCVVVGIIMATGVHQGSLSIAQVWKPFAANYSNVADLGSVLYTTYVWPFEIAAVILLTAIIAAIALTHRAPSSKNTLKQDPSAQSNVQARDRIRIVKLAPSPKK